jgi:hypothetical protein
MLAATAIAVCLIPVTFYVIEQFASRRRQATSQTKVAPQHGETSEETSL